MPPSPEILASYLADIPADRHELARRVHDLVHEADPEITDTRKWGHLTFETPAKRNRVSLINHKNHMNFQFLKGVELDDPKGLLEGSGKGMRHVKLRSADDVATHRETLLAFVKQHKTIDV